MSKWPCPCPCTLDVYTCRTTDFSCTISPAVHRDINALVAGGYSADEIMAALIAPANDGRLRVETAGSLLNPNPETPR